MYEIEYYETLDEKSEYFFTSPPIESKEHFDMIWDILLSHPQNAGLIYRGLKNAGYKLYSSAQREWNKQNLVYKGISFNEYISTSLLLAKADLKLNKHFTEDGISVNNDLAFLSYLQHHYIPNNTPATPLIDFSFNPFVALYFAFEERTNKKNDNEVENYCSFYSVNCSFKYLLGYQNLFYAFINNAKENKLTYDNFSLPPLFHLYTEGDSFRIINNKNIINQEGTFFVHNCEKFPIEKRYKMDIDFARSNNRVRSNAPSQLFLCYDFNTKLKDYVLKRLKEEKGITKEFIYPLKTQSENKTTNV